MENSASSKKNVLNSETLMPLGLFFLAAGAVLSGALWLNTKLSDLKFGQDTLTKTVEQLGTKISSVEGKIDSQFIQRTSFQQWTELLKATNPELNVPEVR